MPLTTRIARIFLSIVLLCMPLGAWAQPKVDDAARAHFVQGKSLAAAGKFADAYREFETSYQAQPRPALLFNMAEAARGMGDVTKARAAYERYLAADPKGALVATAHQRLADLDRASATTKPTVATVPAPSSTTQPTTAKTATSSVSAQPTTTPPPPSTTPSTSAKPASIPSPATAAAQMDAAHPAAPTQAALTDEPTPLWKRKSLWLAVGVAVVAGTVTTIALTRRDENCTGTCIDWTKP